MNQLPANPQVPSRRRLLDDVQQGLGVARPPHISIRGGRFTFITAAGERLCLTRHLDIVVVDGNKFDARVFFEGEFDPNSMDTPPLCFSDNGMGPSKDAIQPQAPTCQQCQWNVRGTDYTFSGRATTACTKRKKLAVIEDQAPDLTIYEFAITPGSLSNFRAYTDWLGKQAHPREARQCDICDVVTRVEWDTTKQFVMKFSCVAWADDDVTLQKVEYVFQNDLGAIACGRTDVAIDPATFTLLPRLASSPALPAPALPAPAQQTQQPAGHQLPPPRQFVSQQQQIPHQTQTGPAQPAPGPKPRKPRGQTAIPPPNPQTATFMASAAGNGQAAGVQSPVPQHASLAEQVQQAAATGEIPAFLRRTQEPAGAAPPTAAPARFGIQQAPPPPAAIADAVQQAMNLPSRRG